MKKVLVYLMLLNSLSGFSQKIDYNKFDSNLATKALAKAFNNFRDTISTFGGGEKWNVAYPEVDLFPFMNKYRWSDWLYNTISLPNCTQLNNDYKFSPFHVDKEQWFKGNINLIRKEYFKGLKNMPKIETERARLTYSENAVTIGGKYETYEELANHMIKVWEKSDLHRCAQRGLGYNVCLYKRCGLKIQNIFSCCVMYNPNNGLTKAVINFIEG